MRVLGAYQKARRYIESQSDISEEAEAKKKKLKPGPCITISRQTGIGATAVCDKITEYLNRFKKPEYVDWVYFDKNLIEKVLEDHDLPDRLNKFIKEENVSTMNSMLNELLGLHPPILKLFHKTTQTILQLAEFGNVIIVGRGGYVVTSRLKNSFHVRLVAPLEDRIANAQKLYDQNRKSATDFIKKEDKVRKEYISKHFHKDVDDPLNFHLVLNTHLLSIDEIADIISNAVIKKFPNNFIQ